MDPVVSADPQWARRPADDFEAQRQRSVVMSRLFGISPTQQSLGRYVLEAVLGSGSMGVIYRARDPTMGRTVAVKVVDLGTRADSGLKEAQLLARVQHPNVVQVFDVGIHQHWVYIVMALVDGPSLRQWLNRSRTWSEIREVLEACGRGLAAGHDVGVVHCDFKPTNVLVTGTAASDRRVFVLDLGVAALVGETAARGGTPRYGAPEVLAGAAPTERSDQFSFCTVLGEALKAQRPNLGRSTLRRLDAIVSKGTALDPAERFRSMRALLADLSAAHRASRWPRRAGFGTVVAALLWMVFARPAERSCDTVVQASATRMRLSIFSRVTPTAGPMASAANRYATQWLVASHQSCQLPDELLAPLRSSRRSAARWCLEQRRVDFSQLLARPASTTADPTTLDSLYGLAPPGLCIEDPQVDEGTMALDSEAAAQLRTLIAAVETGGTTEDLSHAKAQARELRRLAVERRYPRIERRASLALADLEALGGRKTEALALLEAVAWDAKSSGDDLAAARAQIGLIYLAATSDRAPQALGWARHAQASLGRINRPDLEAILLNNTGTAYHALGQQQRALDAFTRARRLALAADADHPRVAMILDNLAVAQRNVGDLAAAEAVGIEALARARTALGPTHTRVAGALSNLGNIASVAGDFPLAVQRHEAALQIYRDLFGPEHREVAKAQLNLGTAHARIGNYDNASVLFLAAKAGFAARGNASDQATAASNLGQLYLELGDSTGAVVNLGEAFNAQLDVLGPEHPATKQTESLLLTARAAAAASQR